MGYDPHDRRLIDGWQRGFPLVSRPYAEIGAALGLDEGEVLRRLCALKESGALSRVGAIVRPNTAGASTLAAIAAPEGGIERIADLVVEEPGVNHAYEREHRYNLWFVATAADRAGVDSALARIGTRTGLPVLDLPMIRDFHIDLGFSIFDKARARAARGSAPAPSAPVSDEDRRLLAAMEDGLALAPEPYAELAQRLRADEGEVRARLAALVESGVVRRLGLVLRHRTFGYNANAMVVWNIADDRLEKTAAQFVAHDFVTLCYRRPRRENWPYNLFTMVHGRERAQTLAEVSQLAALCGAPHEILFSRRCFAQRGARLSAA